MIDQACRLPEIIKAMCQPEYTDYTDYSVQSCFSGLPHGVADILRNTGSDRLPIAQHSLDLSLDLGLLRDLHPQMSEERIRKMVVDRRGPSCFGENYILRSAPGVTLHFPALQACTDPIRPSRLFKRACSNPTPP
jgi:hypothetical protein